LKQKQIKRLLKYKLYFVIDMTIYIFGSNGMLGNYIKLYLKQQKESVVCFTRNDLDVATVTYDKLYQLFANYKINEGDIIINCVGIIPQSKDINDTNIRSYFFINSVFPNMLSTVALQYKMKFLHITTDCVFSGSKGKYLETDQHDETSVYGVSKSLGELSYNATIIRTSIIGEELKNKYSLLEWVRSHSRETINGFKNHYWNGVTCLQLSKIIDKIIKQDIWWQGVRHIFSPQSVTKCKLVEIINLEYSLENTINPIETNTTIDKTLDTIYDTNRLFNIPDIENQIREQVNYID